MWGPATFAGTAADANPIASTVLPALIAMEPDEVAVQVEWIDGGNALGQRVRVQVSYSHASAVPFLFGSGPIDLSAVSVMQIVH